MFAVFPQVANQTLKNKLSVVLDEYVGVGEGLEGEPPTHGKVHEQREWTPNVFALGGDRRGSVSKPACFYQKR
jgi:hypothetical protein